jgi:hypothetical protein
MKSTARMATRLPALLLLAALAEPGFAQTAAPDASASDPFFAGSTILASTPAGTVRLSAEEREAAIEAAATRSGRTFDEGSAGDHRIHGEVGVEVGTGGTRAAYGTAVVPLGDTGVAAFSFETGTSNYRVRRR